MTADLTTLAGLAQGWLAGGLLVFLRIGAAMAVLPAFGEQAVPQRIRLVLALAFTVVVAPAVEADLPPIGADLARLARLGIAEIAVGLLLGIGLRLFVLALQTAGAMAGQASSLSQIFGGSAGTDPQPAIAHLLTIAGLALAVMAGLHVRVAEAFVGSYAAFPAGIFPNPGMVAEWGTLRVAQAFALGFTLAAPFVVASLVYNVALGIINRAMPQLMVAFIGAPALTFGGLALMFLAVPALLAVWLEAFGGFLTDPFGGAP